MILIRCSHQVKSNVTRNHQDVTKLIEVFSQAAWQQQSCARLAQTPGRIQEDLSTLDSNTPMVYIAEPYGGSTFWIRPGVWEDGSQSTRLASWVTGCPVKAMKVSHALEHS